MAECTCITINKCYTLHVKIKGKNKQKTTVFTYCSYKMSLSLEPGDKGSEHIILTCQSFTVPEPHEKDAYRVIPLTLLGPHLESSELKSLQASEPCEKGSRRIRSSYDFLYASGVRRGSFLTWNSLYIAGAPRGGCRGDS